MGWPREKNVGERISLKKITEDRGYDGRSENVGNIALMKFCKTLLKNFPMENAV